MFVKGKGLSKEDIAFSIVLFQKPEYSRPGGPTKGPEKSIQYGEWHVAKPAGSTSSRA